MCRRPAVLAGFMFVALALSGCLGGDSDAPPSAVAAVSAVAGKPDTFLFDATQSTGNGLSYDWSFGDGTNSSEAKTEHTYSYGSGVYAVRLIITDTAGVSGHWTGEVTVGDGSNLPPTAAFSVPKRVYAVGESVRLDAAASQDPDGDPITYHWDMNHLMHTSDYKAFRAKKAEADYDDLENGKSSAGAPLSDAFSRIKDELGPKNGGHDHGGGGDLDYTPSLFMHTVVTTEPVYILETGFPDATVFFIRLQTYDIKGAYADIISEEIWPVQVFNEAPPMTQRDNTRGHFAFGVPAAVGDALPTDQLDDDYQAEWGFETESPVAPGRNDGENVLGLSYINLTWTSTEGIESDIQMRVTLPDGQERSGAATASGRSVELDGRDDFGHGHWTVHLTARAGTQIDWELEYWLRVAPNPFAAYE